MRCILVAVFMVLILASKTTGESILNWFWKEPESNLVELNGVPLVSIPYESTTDDDKFLELAAKFTEIHATSLLEMCQHKIVMKIKTSCNQMPEEELAKLSVNLLNCQSTAEGRKVYPCTDQMSIKDCTKDMDVDTWNTYHLMSNRARAVCYAARSVQFRALAELTVNKLMQTTHTQIHALNSLKNSQDELQEQTSEALDMLHKQSDRLLKQQEHLKDVQIVTQNLVSSNFRELNNEKSIIRAGHAQLTVMTDDVISRLDRVKEKFQGYSEIHDNYYKEVVNNLTNIQKQAQELLDKIQKSADQYDATLKKLKQINESINFLWNVTIQIKLEVEQKWGWLTNYLGNSDEQLKDAYQFIGHAVYLIMSMIVAAFLQAPTLTRICLITIIPLNLTTYWKYGSEASLDFISMTALISLITALNYLIVVIIYLFSNTIKHSKNQIPPGYYTNYSEKKDAKKISLLRRICNEIYYLGRSTCNLSYLLKEKLEMYFQSMIRTIKSVTPREILVRSCSYVPSRKVYDNIVEDNLIPDIDISDDMSNTNVDQLGNEMSGYVRHRGRPREYIDDDSELYPSRSLSPTRKLCIGRTKSGNLCKASTTKGYNYCSRHLRYYSNSREESS